VSDDGTRIEQVRAYWDSRATLGPAAGSNDLPLKQLEIRAIAGHMRDGMRILDAGCGNGATATEIARRHAVDVLGLDYAPQMIEAAQAQAGSESLKGAVAFAVGDVCSLPDDLGSFDAVYTERVLINLPDWPTQAEAVRAIARLVKPGGIYVMCESSRNGLDEINRLRQQVDLPPISPPWHNRYLVDEEVESLETEGLRLESKDAFSSTYYFLSRVVNAWLAREAGEDPAYDAPVNRLAFRLPAFGNTAQTKIWVWRKAG